MKRCILRLILFTVLLFSGPFYSQTFVPSPFTTTPFITMPGDNTDIDVVFSINMTKAFICWVNKLDSVYSVYLRETTSSSNENVLIYSDSNQIANPKIAFVNNSDNNNVRIVWQSFINSHWQILSRKCRTDTLTDVIAITDSLTDNVTPVLNPDIVAWVQNGNLIYRFLDSVGTENQIIDSLNCSNPCITKFSYDYPTIAYEKGLSGNKQIIEAYYNYYSGSSQQWSFSTISNGPNNKNPRMSFVHVQPSYEKYENGVWKAVYQIWNNDSTNNVSYNCENPICFSYQIITKKRIYKLLFL